MQSVWQPIRIELRITPVPCSQSELRNHLNSILFGSKYTVFAQRDEFDLDKNDAGKILTEINT